MTGCCENSTEVSFTPGQLSGGQFLADTRTAGSVTLLQQTILPCLLFANTECSVTLRGGTNAEMAPQVDFVQLVLKPILNRFSVMFDVNIVTRGYFPKGGGEIVVKANPIKEIKPIKLTDRGHIVSVYGRCYVAGVLPVKIAHEMKSVLMRCFNKSGICSPDVHVQVEAIKETYAFGNGSGIQLVAETSTGCLFSGSALGNRNLSNEQVANSAFNELMESLVTYPTCCVDKYLQDQLIIFMALASGKSEIRTGPLTSHTKTAIQIAQTMTGAIFDVLNDGNVNDVIISCEGIGFKNPFL